MMRAGMKIRLVSMLAFLPLYGAGPDRAVSPLALAMHPKLQLEDFEKAILDRVNRGILTEAQARLLLQRMGITPKFEKTSNPLPQITSQAKPEIAAEQVVSNAAITRVTEIPFRQKEVFTKGIDAIGKILFEPPVSSKRSISLEIQTLSNSSLDFEEKEISSTYKPEISLSAPQPTKVIAKNDLAKSIKVDSYIRSLIKDLEREKEQQPVTRAVSSQPLVTLGHSFPELKILGEAELTGLETIQAVLGLLFLLLLWQSFRLLSRSK